MPKKIIKLLQSSVPKFHRQSIFMFDHGNKDPKYRLPDLRQSKKGSSTNYKNSFKRKPKPGEALLSIFRYLSVSINSNFVRYPKIALFWKSIVSRVLKERISKTTFAALTRIDNDAVIANRVRGLNGKSRSTTTNPIAPPTPPPSGEPKKKNQPSERKPEEETVEMRPKYTFEVDGFEEQKFYTEEPYRRSHVNLNLKREWQDEGETSSTELPPPQKCRLSCPLPPPEFSSYENQEYLSNQQPPSVRFSSLPAEFLPIPPKQEEENHQSPSHDEIRAATPEIKTPLETDLKPATASENLKTAETTRPAHSYISVSREVPKMKALLFEPTTLKLKFDAVEAPLKIFKDEVLVQVAYSGVCGTDLFITEGKVPCGESPIILGHEISGRVYAVGKEVDHVVPGDKIAVNAYTACSVCRYCSRGLFSGCLNEGLNNSIGISKNGGWAEYVVVKKSQVHKIPDDLELDQAALIQPLSCILSAMSKLKVLHEMDILVQGLGLTGCLWASVLHSQGYKNVVVCDKTPQRRTHFQSLGTNYSLISPDEVGRHAVDLVVECTGSPNSIEKSLNVLNPNGQMCFFGKPHPVTEVRCIPYEIIRKEITIVGNTGNAFHFSKAIDVANDMKHRYFDFDKLGVKIFDLENFREAFELKKANEVSKIIFKLDS